MTKQYRSKPSEIVERGLLYKFWNWIFDPNYNDYNRTKYNDENWPHQHKWNYLQSVRNKWRIENGRPIGRHYEIDKVIDAIIEDPTHTETKVELVRGWKQSGYDIVHVSFNVYKCSICGKTKHIEAYVAPSKANGIDVPYVVNLSSFKKTTQRIPVIRKEIPVEKVKRYS